ncbi:hypothetical protein [Clostridium taeniosporum]|uniref:Uncharacterized protein n=1 Tax=Clostridium taeniosporum TaxID=394958 RepID=A0A1D7XHD5_9CLOT|nr:hypothetical protein [Clostridium taeniosporum]AOR22479.1 hypothetical protein BGI42_01480 [Clostridium taeniosporum]
MNIVPYNEYLLVMPNGDTKGFNDLELAKAYINIYYERVIDHKIDKNDYNDATEIGAEEPRRNICTQLGVAEGKCEVYNIDNFIEVVRDKVVFDEEREEIISKLLAKEIDFNVYDYNLDNILPDIKTIEMMEQYGDPD